MKRICIFILAFALLAGLAACGAVQSGEQTEASTTTELAAVAPSKAGFERALRLYKCFSMASMQVDPDETVKRENVIFYRVIDPDYPTMDALANALAEVFSQELAQGFLSRTQQDATPWIAVENPAPLYVEFDSLPGELYTCVEDRSSDVSYYGVSAVSESETKIVSKLSALHNDGEKRETLLTQELIDGNWVFTDFSLDW